MRPEISVVIPCLDEAEAIADCVRQAIAALAAADRTAEVLVVENGSRDGSAALAAAAGARVVHEPRRGYGRACLAGFAAARGRYLVMGDGDGSYDLSDAVRLCAALDAGADLVIGSQLRGTIQRSASGRGFSSRKGCGSRSTGSPAERRSSSQGIAPLPLGGGDVGL